MGEVKHKQELGLEGPGERKQGGLSMVEPASLDLLKEQPPDQWLLNDCHTEAQREYWHKCRERSNFLHQMLKDYFSGQSQSAALERFSKKDKEFWCDYRDYWLAFYGLISNAWEDINQVACHLGIEQAEFPETPGQMFIEILVQDAAGSFYICTEYASPEVSKLSPTTMYKQRGQRQRGERKISQKERQEERPFSFLLYLCLWTCMQVAKEDPYMQKKLKEVLRLSAEIDQELYAMIHPSKKVKGYTWINGELQSLTKP